MADRPVDWAQRGAGADLLYAIDRPPVNREPMARSGRSAGLLTRGELDMAETNALPEPRLDGPLTLESTLRRRHSVRDFSAQPLTMAEISQLLWSAQGISDDSGRRTAPSAGATYPLELYLATQEGVFRYISQDHTLLRVQDQDLRRDLFEVALRQDFILEAAATLVFTAVFARTVQRYGFARSPRYIHMEVGHAAQNVLLQAVALGLGAVPVGAYDDDGVRRVLGLPADHVPLYLVSIGHPR